MLLLAQQCAPQSMPLLCAGSVCARLASGWAVLVGGEHAL